MSDSESESSYSSPKEKKNDQKRAEKAKKKVLLSDDDDDASDDGKMKNEPKQPAKKAKTETNGKRKSEVAAEKVAVESSANSSKQKLIKQGGEIATVSKWWEKEIDSDDEETKWRYLEHKGVIFPPFYQQQHFKVTYDGQPVKFNNIQEEMAYYWSQTIGTDYETRDIYRNNFTKEFLGKFDKSLGYKDLTKFNFTPIQTYMAEQKELKKNKTPEQKKAEKEEKKKRDDFYGFAIVDHDLEKIGGYAIEPPTLFKGRGKHPKAGFMKARIMPEQLTLNLAQNAPVPKCTVPGHCWGDIVHNNTVTWLAFYRDDTINTTYKYIFLSASSKFKGLNDRKKYDKARKLKDHIDSIRKDYRKKLNSKDKYEKQLGTATYLIDILALRVGNEKSEDEADTVGCCSLRVEHITMEEDDKLTFDFLGKDSMRYYNTVQLDSEVHKNISDFMKGKKPSDDLFDKISANDLNDYLRELMEGLTAKVFRTYNASFTLQNQLKKKDVSGLELEDKLAFYDEANRQVAILCNHQKTVSKAFDISMDKQKFKLEDMEEYLEELKKHTKEIKKGGKGLDEDVVQKKLNKKIKEKDPDGSLKLTTMKRKFPRDYDKSKNEQEKLEKKIEKEKKKIVQREENKSVALGTSKLNYNDPRITVTWCKNNEVPIERVFSKTVRAKFPWAMYTELDWQF